MNTNDNIDSEVFEEKKEKFIFKENKEKIISK